MIGQKVFVRSYGEKLLKRRVWDYNPEKKMVYICNEGNYQGLIAGDSRCSYIGFPINDVFCFDKDLWNSFENSTDLTPELRSRLMAIDRLIDDGEQADA